MRPSKFLVSVFPFIAAFGLFLVPLAQSEMIEIIDDQELAEIEARGFYFRLDLSIEAFSDAATAPQVVVNVNETTPIEINGLGLAGGLGGGGSINLSGSAQGNLSALINIIGANSVINVGLNIINIQNSTGDYITLNNLNSGTLGYITTDY